MGLTEGAHRATGVWPTAGSEFGHLSAKQRWSVPRKREVALRWLRGESVAVLSRELGVEIYRLGEWRDKALAGIEAALREREGDPLKQELDMALEQIGDLTMTIELLRARIEKPGFFAKGRSRR